MKNQWVESEDTTNTVENKPKTIGLTFTGEVRKVFNSWNDIIGKDMKFSN